MKDGWIHAAGKLKISTVLTREISLQHRLCALREGEVIKETEDTGQSGLNKVQLEVHTLKYPDVRHKQSWDRQGPATVDTRSVATGLSTHLFLFLTRRRQRRSPRNSCTTCSPQVVLAIARA